MFLDDIPGNLAPAKKLGVSTILVSDPTAALASLQQRLGVDLGVTPGKDARKCMSILLRMKIEELL